VNYFIKRDLNEYGPYSLAELQRYVASGNVLLTDLCRSEGMQDWVPVSQVIGNIPVPVAAPAPTAAAFSQVSPYPPPPSLHWGIVLALGIVTCGLFAWVWAIIEAAWVKKVQPESKGLLLWGIAIGLQVIYIVLVSIPDQNARAFAALFQLAGIVLWLVGAFNLRNYIEEHFTVSEPMGLTLSGVMTFFFNVYYFQYHFTQINEIKRSQGQIV
jgi:GYF domain 2